MGRDAVHRARSRPARRASAGTAPSDVGKTLDGSYAAVIDATDAVGTATVSLPFLLDAHPPVVKLAARPVAALGLGGGDA